MFIAPIWLFKGEKTQLFNTQDEVDRAVSKGWGERDDLKPKTEEAPKKVVKKVRNDDSKNTD